MIIEATAADFQALLKGTATRGLRLVPDSVIAPQEVMEMLAQLADSIRPLFAPAAWLIVHDDEIVGLCSLTSVPEDGRAGIGYGIAPTRHGRGLMTDAISCLVDWAQSDPRVAEVAAETGVDNAASQRVLERNGFVIVGNRVDPEDGPLILWRIRTT